MPSERQLQMRLVHAMDQLKSVVRNPDRDDGISPYRPPTPKGFTLRMMVAMQTRKRTKRVRRVGRYLARRLVREMESEFGPLNGGPPRAAD